MKPWTHTEMWK